jgi:PTS system ascorbate-specific IIA component
VHVDDWRSAIRVAGDALIDSQAATADYTEQMIANVDGNGPYIVLAPGLAFAHARPSSAVLKTGMSWVRPARPVAFGHESNDPVTLVVALAATDSSSHTQAVTALARVLSDPATTEALQQAGSAATVLDLLGGQPPAPPSAWKAPAVPVAVHKILTVCGNGLGTSLFLKNTLEQVLEMGWVPAVVVEATDTISAKGGFRSRHHPHVARDRPRPGRRRRSGDVVSDFTSTTEVDAVLRDTYRV